MKTTREAVYAALDSERAYQDALWHQRGEEEPAGRDEHSPEEWLTYIVDYVREAQHILSRESYKTSYPKAAHSLRKIAALAVAAMEQHGAPKR